jgi:hypothetical protein
VCIYWLWLDITTNERVILIVSGDSNIWQQQWIRTQSPPPVADATCMHVLHAFSLPQRIDFQRGFNHQPSTINISKHQRVRANRRSLMAIVRYLHVFDAFEVRSFPWPLETVHCVICKNYHQVYNVGCKFIDLPGTNTTRVIHTHDELMCW